MLSALLYIYSEILDGKEITETSRQFLRNWHASKETQKKRHDEFIRQGMPTEFSDVSGEICYMFRQFRISLFGFI